MSSSLRSRQRRELRAADRARRSRIEKSAARKKGRDLVYAAAGRKFAISNILGAGLAFINLAKLKVKNIAGIGGRQN